MELVDLIKAYHFLDEKSREEFIKTRDRRLAVGYSEVLNSTLTDSWGTLAPYTYVVSKTQVALDT